MRKLINILCHPSFIGMYLLDKISTVLLILSFFFVITTSIFAIDDMAKPIFSPNISNALSDVLLHVDDISDTTYINKQLTGSKKTINCEGIYIYMNESAYINNNRNLDLVLVFSHSEANGYYAGFNIGKIKYEDLNISDFSFKEINESHSVVERMKFEALVLALLNSMDMNYRSVYFWNDFLNMVIFALIAFVVCYIASIIRNPDIEARIRRKLVLYDNVIFYVFVWFKIFFRIDWLLYVGILFSLIYTLFTFSRIKKVNKKRVM